MSTTIPLPARVDLGAALTLQEAFLAASGSVRIAAQDVEMIGAQGLQVLIAGRRHIAALGGSVGVDAPAEAFLNCLSDMGADLAMIETEDAP